ncbi:EamA family transporter [Alicyclobacillus cellulosilyticus]|nr:DMT family transporter [Alicyclobacillus cellulosilyticus]
MGHGAARRRMWRRRLGSAGLVLLAGSSYGIGSSVLKGAYAHGFTSAEVTSAQFLFALWLTWLGAFVERRAVRRGPEGVPAGDDRGFAGDDRGSAGDRPGSGSGRRDVSGRRGAQGGAAWARSRGRGWMVLGVLGLSGAECTYTYYTAVQFLPASFAIVLSFQFSWMVLVIDALVRRYWPRRDQWLGAAAICAGTVLAAGLLEHPGVWHGPGMWPLGAVLLGLASALGYAVNLYVAGYADATVPPALRTAVVITCSTLITFLLIHPGVHFADRLGQGLWMWGLIMALTSQVIPTWLLLTAVPNIGGRMAGVLGAIELPVAVAAAHALVGEPVSAGRWMGVVLILAGIVVSEWRGLRAAGTPQPKHTCIRARILRRR